MVKKISKQTVFHVMDDVFGMKSHFLRAMVVLWVTTSIGIIALKFAGWKQASVQQIVLHILVTGLIMLASMFSATCFRFGDCPRTAYLSATAGIFLISTAALMFE